jgi:hypothetical protein
MTTARGALQSILTYHPEVFSNMLAATAIAIDSLGGPTECSRKLSEFGPVDRTTVNRWKRFGVPPFWAPKLAELSGVGLRELIPYAFEFHGRTN